MKGFKLQKAQLLCFVLMGVLISILTGCGGGGGGVWMVPAAEKIRPTVTSTAPVLGAADVSLNARVITANFSEKMNPATITGTTYTVKQGATVVSGAVTYTGVSAVFTAFGDLLPGLTYTATITTAAKDLAGNALAADYTWTFSTGAAADIILPLITSTVNANGATGVAFNTKVGATFSEPMDPSTINTTTFSLKRGATDVPGTLDYTGVNLVFTPTSLLAAGTVYTATVTTGARDLAGNALAANYVWSWTTGAAADITRPRVIATINSNGAIDVPTNTKVGATFSEPMDPLTITTATFTLSNGTTYTNVPGTMLYSGVDMVFTPSSPLAPNTTYIATITTGAKDLAGNELGGNKAPLPLASDFGWFWTTAAAPDTTNPTVILTAPLNGAINVPTGSTINATFSEAMDPLTITNATFSVAGVPGLVTYDGVNKIATLTPSSPLAAGTTYTATVTTGARDLAGNPLLLNKVWSFTTAAVVIPPPVVPLGSVAPFGTFGGSAGMTNQGTLTIINGDIGTIATATSTVTGFHDTEGDIFTQTGSNIGGVNGTIYTCTVSTTGPNSTVVNAPYCAIATQARLDAETAFNFLAGMPSSGVLAGNLAGTTIYPGVYTNSSAVMIEGGDLTLDAQGDANALFVFQIGSTLTVGGPGAAFPQSITLINGAQAKNVFWQVGTFATINAGGGGTMVGTIIAQSGVSFSTAGNVALVTLNGRALSLVSSVTMVNTIINVPAP
ncbi:MAG: Ig-like domain-containing protein [Geobacteraceae bacterium]|nr:Ig-like domain-containing protein [Geobacteraceae bacterium]